MHKRLLVFIAIVAVHGWADAILGPDDILALRAAKARNLQPEVRDPGEVAFRRWSRHPLLRALFTNESGFRPAFGGMVPGAGFTAGLDWSRPDLLEERLAMRVRARGSTREYYLSDLQIALPHLADDRAFVVFTAGHTNFAQMPYFGLGRDTHRRQRSHYRLEETAVSLRTGVRPFSRLSLGVLGGVRAFNAGPGSSSSYPSTETQFDPAAAPGIDRQGSFWQSGAFASYDSRSEGTQPVSGGLYLGEFSRMNDRSFGGAYSHSRIDLDASHYVPFLGNTRVIAFHGHATMTDTRADQTIPFYLQASVGGAESLRGFRPFRFTDRNAMWFNAEYRWETSLGLDMAVFADAGKVARRWSQLNMHDLETSYGLGFRAKARRNLLVRLDAGVSREGVGIWLRFQNIF